MEFEAYKTFLDQRFEKFVAEKLMLFLRWFSAPCPSRSGPLPGLVAVPASAAALLLGAIVLIGMKYEL